MSAPLVDLALKNLLDFILRQVIADPESSVKEIFGDAQLDPLAALYGNRMQREIIDWITTTKIPVVLGFELSPAQIPGVTIHLASSTPKQPYMGDQGLFIDEPLQPFDRAVIVPKFVPAALDPSADFSSITITLPASLTSDQLQLVTPGLRLRDKNGKEYGIGENKDKPTAIALDPLTVKNAGILTQADLSEIEVISPIEDATFNEGVMTFEEEALVTVHGHANRTEGLWLWAIVQHGLLKYRPILTQTFGLDLALPTASDFRKDDQFLGENVWRRFLTLSTTANWSWKGARHQDVVAFILGMKAGRENDSKEEVEIKI